VDLHFHGAFGIDLMTADQKALDRLSAQLWDAGISGFCATTLSTTKVELESAVRRLGSWIKAGSFPGAWPLGIHLEGPFIHPGACGAHPPGSIRPFSKAELLSLISASQDTIRLLTIAPEQLSAGSLTELREIAHKHQITLSLGHSRATEAQAKAAFDQGFTSLTHAWNALPFHHREPGPLGAALGRSDVFIELILDQIHVSPTVIRWTRALHPSNRTCLISDCVPAGGLSTPAGRPYRFGPLMVERHEGASRLPDGALAGGGLLLTESYAQWLLSESAATGLSAEQLFKESLTSLTDSPLAALKLPHSTLRSLRKLRQVDWQLDPQGRLCVIPVDSNSRRG